MADAPNPAYVVLARKYRPQRFVDLIGQEPIVRTLRNAMALGRVHHAFVLAGARGVGKTTTARLLAKSLNCEAGERLDACGQCPSCLSIASGSAVQVIEIDGASNTGVDSVRELREAARYKPALGRYKIYIVDEVHMLSQAAFNALLKLLEEPPPHVKFIFATTEPHKIPATILSRCQRFDFRRVPQPTLAAHLGHVAQREGVTVSPGALAMLARDGEGSVRDALSLLDQAIGFAGDEAVSEATLEAMGAIDRQVLFALLEAILQRQADDLLRLVDELDVQGHDWAELMRLFLLHVRDVALCQAQSGAHAQNEGQKERLHAQAQARGAEDWQRLFEKASVVAEAVARSPVPKATLEMGLLRLMQIAPAADVGRLLDQIDSWMAALPSAPPPAAATPAATVAPVVTQSSAFAETAQKTPASDVRDGHGAPDEPQGVHAGWRAFNRLVQTRRPALASLLEQAQVVAWQAGEVRLALSPEGFAYKTLRDKPNTAAIEELLGEHFGAPTALRWASSGAEAPSMGPSLAQERVQQKEQAQSDAQAQAQAHPAVQTAQRVLGAQLTTVSAWADPKRAS